MQLRSLALLALLGALSRTATANPLAKVIEMIDALTAKVVAEGEAEEKAYVKFFEWCDDASKNAQNELTSAGTKKGELEEDVSKLSTKIDKASAKSTTLKEEVKKLQAELAALAKSQAESDSIRAENHADYSTAKADLEEGLAGVRKALGVLRDYYGSGAAAMLQEGDASDVAAQQPEAPEKFEKATGAGTSIIGILEVVESDFAKNLAEVEAEEADQESAYEKTTQDNAVTKVLKDQDVKYKTQEYKALDKALSELAADLDTKEAELKAVLDYYAKVKERCIAKAETYEERKAKREAEIAGLKQALDVLENGSSAPQGLLHPDQCITRQGHEPWEASRGR